MVVDHEVVEEVVEKRVMELVLLVKLVTVMVVLERVNVDVVDVVAVLEVVVVVLVLLDDVVDVSVSVVTVAVVVVDVDAGIVLDDVVLVVVVVVQMGGSGKSTHQCKRLGALADGSDAINVGTTHGAREDASPKSAGDQPDASTWCAAAGLRTEVEKNASKTRRSGDNDCGTM